MGGSPGAIWRVNNMGHCWAVRGYSEPKRTFYELASWPFRLEEVLPPQVGPSQCMYILTTYYILLTTYVSVGSSQTLPRICSHNAHPQRPISLYPLTVTVALLTTYYRYPLTVTIALLTTYY